jgi:FkbM family methyltransferase
VHRVPSIVMVAYIVELLSAAAPVDISRSAASCSVLERSVSGNRLRSTECGVGQGGRDPFRTQASSGRGAGAVGARVGDAHDRGIEVSGDLVERSVEVDLVRLLDGGFGEGAGLGSNSPARTMALSTPRCRAKISRVIGRNLHRLRRAADALSFSAGRRAIRLGVLPSHVHQATLRRIAPEVVIDAGANRGQFSLDVVRVLPSAMVHAFEPLSSEADVFEAIFAGEPNVKLTRRGLWSQSGSMTMHVSASPDSSSLLPIGAMQSEIFPGTHDVGEDQVEVVRLDEVMTADDLGSQALLKLDVQGSELEVLRGAAHLLRSCQWVYAELSLMQFYVGQPSAGEIVAHLLDASFELVDVTTAARHRGQAVQVDALFEHRPSTGVRPG